MNNDDAYICTYDNRGNLLKVYENNILTCKYTYDEFSRLIREDNLLFDSTITYKYNEFGELSERKTYKYTLMKLPNNCNTDYYTYSNDNQHKLLAYNDEKFNYDNSGNPIIYRDAKLKWSNSKNLLSIDNNSHFKYNKQNVRTCKTIGDETTKFRLNGNKIASQNNGDMLIFIYNNNEVCGFSYKTNNSSHDFVYKKNFNGDIVGIYDSNNELICKYVYDAFGNHKVLIKNNNDYLDISITIPNQTNSYFSFIANINPYRFHSLYFDIETGLYYANGKYYDSELGKFLNT